VIKAGGELRLAALQLNNALTGDISAHSTLLHLAQQLINRGLIDGEFTEIVTATLNNLGTGRLYGDQIVIQANTLNNLAEGDNAATLAARERLDIGVTELNNRDHALIYSGGSLAIGGMINNQQASGQATTLNNHSATIESAGDMHIASQFINNINDNLLTEVVITEQSRQHDMAYKGSPIRYQWANVDDSYKNKYNVKDAIVSDTDGKVIARGNDFYEYLYDRTVTETQIVQSDPGQIIAGGNLSLNADQLTNRDSRIIAGGTLGGVIGTLNNHATQGVLE
jgi:filamentous hemagglutinin